jgi:hypothetical protein
MEVSWADMSDLVHKLTSSMTTLLNHKTTLNYLA